VQSVGAVEYRGTLKFFIEESEQHFSFVFDCDLRAAENKVVWTRFGRRV
jgi:hypothetical protein